MWKEKPIETVCSQCTTPLPGSDFTDAPNRWYPITIEAPIQGFCWSPDGKRIAYTWRQIHAEKAASDKVDERETESHLCICDADGKNHKTLLTEKGTGQWMITMGGVDWR